MLWMHADWSLALQELAASSFSKALHTALRRRWLPEHYLRRDARHAPRLFAACWTLLAALKRNLLLPHRAKRIPRTIRRICYLRLTLLHPRRTRRNPAVAEVERAAVAAAVAPAEEPVELVAVPEVERAAASLAAVAAPVEQAEQVALTAEPIPPDSTLPRAPIPSTLSRAPLSRRSPPRRPPTSRFSPRLPKAPADSPSSIPTTCWAAWNASATNRVNSTFSVIRRSKLPWVVATP